MQQQVTVGMGGWDVPPFAKYFYPNGRGKNFRKLAFYSEFFDHVELNATFYNTSFTPAHARLWLHDVGPNPDFRFTVKLFHGFTHTLTATREDVVRVHRLIAALADGGRFDGLLAQFPYSFTNLEERRAYIAHLRRAFAPYRFYLEVRHNSWHTGALPEFLAGHDITPVNVDLPAIREHMPLTASAWNGAAYFRMMGRNARAWLHPWRVEEDGRHVVSDRYHYLYSTEELEYLFRLITGMRANARAVRVVFHNDPSAQSLVNGFQFRHRLESERSVRVPGNFLRLFPSLAPISAAAAQPLPPAPLFAGCAA